jgi:glutamine amidotransferase
MIAIIDYGAGNLKSVKKAFDYIGVDNHVVSSIQRLRDVDVDGVVLPGVGAFGAAVKKLQNSGFLPVLIDYLHQNKPFLGICLGMQLMMASSEESKDVKGFNRFKGECKRFQIGKVPQIGWNQISKTRKSTLLKGIGNHTFFYFIHSYYVSISRDDAEIVAATSRYHIDFVSVIEYGKICAVQFHPEKSGNAGLKVLENWVNQC